jgi:hypothetical protein
MIKRIEDNVLHLHIPIDVNREQVKLAYLDGRSCAVISSDRRSCRQNATTDSELWKMQLASEEGGVREAERRKWGDCLMDWFDDEWCVCCSFSPFHLFWRAASTSLVWESHRMMLEWDSTSSGDTDRLVACPIRNVDEDKRARFVAHCTDTHTSSVSTTAVLRDDNQDQHPSFSALEKEILKDTHACMCDNVLLILLHLEGWLQRKSWTNFSSHTRNRTWRGIRSNYICTLRVRLGGHRGRMSDSFWASTSLMIDDTENEIWRQRFESAMNACW